MVDADMPSVEDLELQHVLKEHPAISYRLSILVNGFRDLVKACASGEMDPAEVARALAKSESVMRRMGLPVLETWQDWLDIRVRMGRNEKPV